MQTFTLYSSEIIWGVKYSDKKHLPATVESVHPVNTCYTPQHHSSFHWNNKPKGRRVPDPKPNRVIGYNDCLSFPTDALGTGRVECIDQEWLRFCTTS